MTGVFLLSVWKTSPCLYIPLHHVRRGVPLQRSTDCLDGVAVLRCCIAQLLLRDVELQHPELLLVRLVEVDAAAFAWCGLLLMIGHVHLRRLIVTRYVVSTAAGERPRAQPDV